MSWVKPNSDRDAAEQKAFAERSAANIEKEKQKAKQETEQKFADDWRAEEAKRKRDSEQQKKDIANYYDKQSHGLNRSDKNFQKKQQAWARIEAAEKRKQEEATETHQQALKQALKRAEKEGEKKGQEINSLLARKQKEKEKQPTEIPNPEAEVNAGTEGSQNGKQKFKGRVELGGSGLSGSATGIKVDLYAEPPATKNGKSTEEKKLKARAEDLRNQILSAETKGNKDAAKNAQKELDKVKRKLNVNVGNQHGRKEKKEKAETNVKPQGEKLEIHAKKTNRQGMEKSLKNIGELAKKGVSLPDKKKGKVTATLHVIKEGNTTVAIKTKQQGETCVGYSGQVVQGKEAKWTQAKEPFIL